MSHVKHCSTATAHGHVIRRDFDPIRRSVRAIRLSMGLVATTGAQHPPRPDRMLVVDPAAHERLKPIGGSRGGVGSTNMGAG